MYPVTLNTGISDSIEANTYMTINNYSYITYNYSWFNGNETFVEYVSPWQKNIMFNSEKSTNGFENPSPLKR